MCLFVDLLPQLLQTRLNLLAEASIYWAKIAFKVVVFFDKNIFE